MKKFSSKLPKLSGHLLVTRRLLKLSGSTQIEMSRKCYLLSSVKNICMVKI